MEGWPIVEWDGAAGYFPVQNSAQIFDYNGEIYVAFASEHNVFLFDLAGNVRDGWPKRYPEPFISSGPIVGDVDGDGRPELMVRLRNLIHGPHIELHVLTLDGGELEQFAIDWL